MRVKRWNEAGDRPNRPVTYAFAITDGARIVWGGYGFVTGESREAAVKLALRSLAGFSPIEVEVNRPDLRRRAA